MISEVVFSILCLFISLRYNTTRDGFLILLFVATCETLNLTSIPNHVYETLFAVSCGVTIKFIKSQLIKAALKLLIIFTLISFCISLVYEFSTTDYLNAVMWSMSVSWFGLYEYIYYATLCLILLGLWVGGDSGNRANKGISGALMRSDICNGASFGRDKPQPLQTNNRINKISIR